VEEVREQAKRAEHADLPRSMHPEVRGKRVVGFDDTAGEDLKMPVATAESRPAGKLYLQEECMCGTPIQRLAWMGHQSLPQAISQFFKMLVLGCDVATVANICAV